MIDEILRVMADGGAFGVIAALSVYALFKLYQVSTEKDKKIIELYDRFQATTEARNERYHVLANELNLTVQTILDKFQLDDREE